MAQIAVRVGREEPDLRRSNWAQEGVEMPNLTMRGEIMFMFHLTGVASAQQHMIGETLADVRLKTSCKGSRKPHRYFPLKM
jgi:hypothetical protein